MPASSHRVWVASAPELNAAARLLGEFRSHLGAGGPTDDQIRAGVERIAEIGDGAYLLGAIGDGEPQGVCQIRFRWSVWTDSDDAWLEDLYVADAARGRGLGRALLEAAIDHAESRGCARIELDVDEANEPARRLYRAAGFSGELKATKRSLLLGRRLRPRGAR